MFTVRMIERTKFVVQLALMAGESFVCCRKGMPHTAVVFFKFKFAKGKGKKL